MSALLEAAERYARRGWPVFPCAPSKKVPMTPRGFYDATTDLGEVRRFWERSPAANVGVRTGAESGLVVLDVDGEEGFDSLTDLVMRYGEPPTTASVKTPSGGSHFYFRHPGGVVPNSAGLLGRGLDVRGDGGYVLAPPSVVSVSRLGDRRYEPDDQVPIQPLPPWLVTRPPTLRKPESADTWVGMIRDGLDQGSRNHDLARLVGHLLARDVDARLVLELAYLVNSRARPPLPDREVEQIVSSIAGREVRKRVVGAR